MPSLLSTITVHQIKKRNGEVVEFQPEKITLALTKAFIGTKTVISQEKLLSLTENIVGEVQRTFVEKVPSVEDVQNLVEQTLMANKYFAVAKAYILYRHEHAKEREEKKKVVVGQIQEHTLFVTKQNGQKEPFLIDKVKKTLQWAASRLSEPVDIDAVVSQCQMDLYDGINTRDITKALILTTRSFIEQDPAYSQLAASLLLYLLYKDVIGGEAIDAEHREGAYRATFLKNIQKGIDIGRLDPLLLEFDLEHLAASLVIERDYLFKYLGLQTLYDRYFLQDPDTRTILETPQAFWMRIAMGLATLEKENRNKYAMKFYEALSTLRFVASTPTLFHAGTVHPQLSSCYLNTVRDSLDHIFKCISDNAQLSKWSGGIGTDWSNLRGTGALIRGTGVESQGVIPFLKIANDTTVAINRSGRRRGAACVYLETWHIDIEDFMELRKNTGDERRRTHDMDTAHWIPDLFMKRVRDDQDWTLFSPDETPELHHLFGRAFEQKYEAYESLAKEGKLKLTRTVRARELWKKMLAMLFETGHPWVTFKDPCNIRSPQDHVGIVHCSNLCTEITLNTSAEETAVCNLGSVNLAQHIQGRQLDRELLKDTIQTAMRMLDNVIDINFYPTPETKVSNMRHRPVGLGVMGLQDALYMLDINFDAEDGINFSDESMEFISHAAIFASSLLAKERGRYASYKGSKWDRGIFPVDTITLLEQERGEAISLARIGKLDWSEVRALVKEYGMRNSNCLAIAPTATISNIADCFPSIEPIYKNLYVKSNVSGDFTIINKYLVEDLKALHLWDYEMLGKLKYHDGSIADIPEIPARLKGKYKEVFEMDPKWLLQAAAERGKWIDQSQSLNLFFVGSSGRELSELYMYAWQLGLKTTYYLRTLAESQVEKSTVDISTFGVTHKRQMQVRGSFSPLPVATGMESKKVMDPVPSVSLQDTGSMQPLLCKVADASCEACQ